MEVHILTTAGTGIDERGSWCTAKLKEGEAAERRRRALVRLDRELEQGNCKAALGLMKQFKAHPAGFVRGFGAAKASGSASSFMLGGKNEISSLQLVVDAMLDSIKRSLDFQLQEEEAEVLAKDIGKAADADNRDSVYEDHLMCMQHEAGHFLVGYMLGVLPRRYKVPSVEDLFQDKFACGKVDFVGFEFLKEVGVDALSKRNLSKRRLNTESLRTFSCVILGGLAAEHLVFGYSELLHSDVEKLDRVVRWLKLTETEAELEHRQGAEGAVMILSSESEALCNLAEAMALGRSVGFCIGTIENALKLS